MIDTSKHILLCGKTDFLFSGMDIDINLGGINLDKQDVSRIRPMRDKSIVPISNRFGDKRDFNNTLVDEQTLTLFIFEMDFWM